MAREPGRNDLDGWLDSWKSANISGSLDPDIKRRLLSLASDHASLPCVGAIPDAVQQPSQQISPKYYTSHVRQDDVNSNHFDHIGKTRAYFDTPKSNCEEEIFTTTHKRRQIVSTRESQSVLMSGGANQIQRDDSTPGLAARMRAAMAKTYSGAEFLPRHALEKILTEDRLRREFDANGFEDSQQLALYIHTHAKKVFAILILLGLERSMPQLACQKFKDEYLPLVSTDGCMTSSSGIPQDHPALRPFGEWQTSDIERFCTNQWLALAPTFDTGKDYEFDSSVILPFVEARTIERSTGGYGRVSQVKISPDHLPSQTKSSFFALKTLLPVEQSHVTDSLDAVRKFRGELDVVRKIRGEHTVLPLATFQHGPKHYFMFPWANGNLRDLWDKQEIHEPDRFIRWTVEQCHGLADALNTIHSLDKAVTNCAWHGNINPTNILWFRGEFVDLGTLKISDFGISQNLDSTGLSRTRFPTPRHSSPEVEQSKKDLDYTATDKFSLGCVFFELIAWILHGNTELSRFEKDCNVWTADPAGDGFPNDCVSQIWIRHLSEYLSNNCIISPSPVLGDLLEVVVNQVVAGKPSRWRVSTSTDHLHTVHGSSAMAEAMQKQKFTMQDVSEQMQVIRNRMSLRPQTYLHHPSFRLHENGNGPLDPQLPSMSFEEFESQEMRSKKLEDKTVKKFTPTVVNKLRASVRSHDVWIPIRDNLFAKNYFASLTRAEIARLAWVGQSSKSLCSHCSDTKTGLAARTSFKATLAQIISRRSICAQCTAVCKRLKDLKIEDPNTLILRENSSLTTRRGDPPILNLIVGPQTSPSKVPNDIQRGLPALPAPGSDVQIKLMRQWLAHCNTHHECQPGSDVRMPFRLIDIRGQPGRYGRLSLDSLRIDCSIRRKDHRYAVLSHRWASTDLNVQSRLAKANHKRWQTHFSCKSLPKRFQEAILIARGLGLQYIWIDSLCIIQDDCEDTEREISNMEAVFSNAYITISATCAIGHHTGFLRRENPRTCHPIYIPFESGKQSRVYLCDPIDDFRQHVEESELSRRGWIFQERALSRRILHFTSTQLYWECGSDVRSEALSKFNNQHPSFFSDPDFPNSIYKHGKSFRIDLFQQTYEEFSSLEFTVDTDRAVAISGLESRLAKLYGSASYGLVHDPQDIGYLIRSLLWQRESQCLALVRLKYPPGRQIPSCSWMSVKGPISYLHVPLTRMDWLLVNALPFFDWFYSSAQKSNRGLATCLVCAGAFSQVDGDNIVLDRPTGSTALDFVVLGTEAANLPEGRERHYGLLVAATGGSDEIYERVGVAVVERDAQWAKSLMRRIDVA
ncbi:hypothetical protein HBI24_006400 [Parastagonospora nodorum]|nr:hypothetical protein HBI24_006400 [Parastagonospora nodorum]KAH5703254.1 hypothetical protein HBI44_020020 [Parastagonospora nodorum]